MTAAAPSRCRTPDCGAPIRWARTETGKAIPIDAEPTPDGNITVHRDDSGQVIATVHANGEALEGPRWTSHFATCAQAAQHRKRPAPEPTAVAGHGLEAPALLTEPAERRPDWAGCTGCGHQVLNPAVGEPLCPGCQHPLPAGITRTRQETP